VFDRVVNQLSAAAATTSTGVASTTSAQAAAALMRFGGISTGREQDKPGEESIREEDGLLSVDTAETMLKWHAEATGRCLELSPPNDMYELNVVRSLRPNLTFSSAKNIFALLRVLAEAIGNAYVEAAIET
jgi:exocyst complex component 5